MLQASIKHEPSADIPETRPVRTSEVTLKGQSCCCSCCNPAAAPASATPDPAPAAAKAPAAPAPAPSPAPHEIQWLQKVLEFVWALC